MATVCVVTIEHIGDYAEARAFGNYYDALICAAETIIRRVAAGEGRAVTFPDAIARRDCSPATLEALISAYAATCRPFQEVTLQMQRLTFERAA